MADTQVIDIKEIINPVTQQVTDNLSKLFGPRLDAIDGKLKPPEKPPEPPKKEDTARLEERRAGMVGQIMDFEFMGVPVGQAAVGGFGAVFATEFIDGVLATQTVQVKGIVKLVAAGATAMWAKPLLGSTGSKVVAMLMTFDALRDLTPIDIWAKQWAAMLSGFLPTGGLADVSGRRAVSQTRKNTDSVLSRIG